MDTFPSLFTVNLQDSSSSIICLIFHVFVTNSVSKLFPTENKGCGHIRYSAYSVFLRSLFQGLLTCSSLARFSLLALGYSTLGYQRSVGVRVPLSGMHWIKNSVPPLIDARHCLIHRHSLFSYYKE